MDSSHYLVSTSNGLRNKTCKVKIIVGKIHDIRPETASMALNTFYSSKLPLVSIDLYIVVDPGACLDWEDSVFCIYTKVISTGGVWQNEGLANLGPDIDYVVFWDLTHTLKNDMFNLLSHNLDANTLYILQSAKSEEHKYPQSQILLLPSDLLRSLGGFILSSSHDACVYSFIKRTTLLGRIKWVMSKGDGSVSMSCSYATESDRHVAQVCLDSSVSYAAPSVSTAKSIAYIHLPTSGIDTILSSVAQGELKTIYLKAKAYVLRSYSEVILVPTLPVTNADQKLIILSFPSVLNDLRRRGDVPIGTDVIWPWSESYEDDTDGINIIPLGRSKFCSLFLQYPNFMYSRLFIMPKTNPSPVYSVVREESTHPNHKICAHLHCYNLDLFNSIYGPYIDSISQYCDVVVTFCCLNQKTRDKLYWDLPYTFLLVENRGFDLGAKFALVHYLKQLQKAYESCLFLHSKSCPVAREKFFQVTNALRNNSDLDSGYCSGKMHRLFATNKRMCMASHCSFEHDDFTYASVIDALRFFKRIEFENPRGYIDFCEGNCFLIPWQNAVTLYGNSVVYTLLNTAWTFDYAWYSVVHKLADQPVDRVYNRFRDLGGAGNVLHPNSALTSLWRDGQIEHVLERVVYSIVPKWVIPAR